MTLWHGIVCGDVLTKILLKTRPYERVPGTTDSVLEESIALLQESFRASGSGLHEALAESVSMFKGIERTNGQKPKVGIVGEIYVRNDDFINQNVARAVEEYGGEALKTSIAEWIFYTSYMHRIRRERGIKEALGRVKNWIQEFYFNHVEHGLYEIAEELIHDRPEPKIDDIMEAGRKYIAMEFEGEAILTIGRALIYIEKEGVDAVVNASPTFCMPGTTTTSIFARIEDELGVPIICNFYDGSGEPNKVLRPHLHCLSHKGT
jgi:predicted nucleotide-binding protein (sugar kinase/HSP70/actin superfamily)